MLYIEPSNETLLRAKRPMSESGPISHVLQTVGLSVTGKNQLERKLKEIQRNNNFANKSLISVVSNA